jgi:hypothetical protein
MPQGPSGLSIKKPVQGAPVANLLDQPKARILSQEKPAMKTSIASLFAVTAFASANAGAVTVNFADSLVVIIANNAPDTSFSFVNGNLPDGDRVSIDNSTSDYNALGVSGRGVSRALLRFDDFSLPTGAVVNSATLNFFTKSAQESGSSPVRMYEMLTAWDNTSTWNSFGNGISLDDVEASSTPFVERFNIPDETPISFDATALVQAWADGSSNAAFGIFIRNFSSDGWDIQVASNGGEFAPFLTVDYTAAAPVPVPAAVWLLGSALAGVAGVARRRG